MFINKGSSQTHLMQILTFFRAVWMSLPSALIGPASIVPTLNNLCPSIAGPPVGLVVSLAVSKLIFWANGIFTLVLYEHTRETRKIRLLMDAATLL